MPRAVVFVNTSGANWTLDELDGSIVVAAGTLDVTGLYTDDELMHAIQNGLNLEFDAQHHLRINGFDLSGPDSADYGNQTTAPYHAINSTKHLPGTNGTLVGTLAGFLVEIPFGAAVTPGALALRQLVTGDISVPLVPAAASDAASASYVGTTVNTGIATHVALPDPHTQYQKESEKSAFGGYASLDGAGKVPLAELPAFPLPAHAASHETGADLLTLSSIPGAITNTQHGNRGGGTLHPAATPNPAGVDGFLSAADKTRLDGMETGADVTANHPPQAHKDLHRSGGGDQFIATDVLEAAVKRLQETGGPTILAMGFVPDGTVLQRSGANIVGGVAETRIENTITTNNNAWTTIATIALANNTAYLIDVDIIARRTDAADRAGYVRRAIAYREAAGVATLQGSDDASLTRESDGTWDSRIGVSGNNVIVEIRGGAGASVNWKSRYKLTSVA